MSDEKYILLTRPKKDRTFAKNLGTIGYKVLYSPTITIKKKPLFKKDLQVLSNFKSFDWILFTSKNGVKYFLLALKTLNINRNLLKSQNIAAVGSETAQELIKYKLKVSFIPPIFTTKSLADNLPLKPHQKVLIPRAEIASSELIDRLTKRGANVTRLNIYQTEFKKKPNSLLKNFLKNNQIIYLTFTSPSTVQGFLKNLTDNKIRKKILKIPVISIGPVTTHALKKAGFQDIHTSQIHTINGMLKTIKEVL